ncbi:MAG: hypothetical protein R2942_09685 [Ignavibacteria bacterium]
MNSGFLMRSDWIPHPDIKGIKIKPLSLNNEKGYFMMLMKELLPEVNIRLIITMALKNVLCSKGICLWKEKFSDPGIFIMQRVAVTMAL